MRMIQMKVSNTKCFYEDIVINFNTSDGVRSSDNMGDFDAPVYKIKPGIYTQNTIGIVGLNATGKTTILEIMLLILHVVFNHQLLNYDEAARILHKIFPEKSMDLKWEAIFIDKNKIYKLESIIGMNEQNRFFYKDETIYSKNLALINSRNWNIFSENDMEKKRADEKQNPYLKNDATIAQIIGDYEGKILSTENTVNFNLPYWKGSPEQSFIKCFDPNIRNIKVDEASGEMTLSFFNQNRKYIGNLLSISSSYLSSGTIKGLSLLPTLIEAFEYGGYVIIDELENHLNKKIIEWVIGLFSDKRVNPKGACLIFTTHYSELLDCFTRKDNIYVNVRKPGKGLQIVRFSDIIKRNELAKSKIILSNFIKGTAPSYVDLINAKKCIINMISKEQII